MSPAVMTDTTADATQAEGEGPDGSDKPPTKTTRSPSKQFTDKQRLNGTRHRATSPIPASTPTATNKQQARITPQTSGTTPNEQHIPLPPPDSQSYPKAPGTTRKDLEKKHLEKELQKVAANGVTPTKQSTSSSTASSATPPSTESPSISENESWSLPSTQPPSRAPSFSGGKSGGRVVDSSKTPPATTTQGAKSPSKKEGVSSKTPAAASGELVPPPQPRSRASSVHSDGGQKFSLKDLLGAGPKLVRRSSARSTSSKKSDSDRGGARSSAGDSTQSLLKKYGVCEKVAIGKGATSVVRLAHKWDRSEEKLYAVKEFRKRRKNETEKEYVKKLTAEFCISSTLHHINIVETVDLVQDENLRWCEVMEFCPGGDLYAAIKRGGMSPAEVECCFKQILTGVNYLHSQGVAHRDIKPENLFFDTQGHLKIGDYGASTVYRLPWETTVHMSTGLCGSEPYIAPEQFTGKPYDARLVDIWACGIVYYCLHFQELPWTVARESDSLFSAYLAACSSTQPAQSACPPTISNLSPRACRPLIRKMLEPNPKLRSTIEDVIAHQWIQSIEVCYLSRKPTHMHVYAQAMAQAQIQVLAS